MKILMQVFRVHVFILIATLIAGCVSDQTFGIRTADRAVSGSTSDVERLRNLLNLQRVCRQTNLSEADDEARATCQQDFGPQILKIREQKGVRSDEVFILPVEWLPRAPGLARATNQYRPAYYLCGTLFNMGRSPVRAVRVEIVAFDPFEKQLSERFEAYKQFRSPVESEMASHLLESVCSETPFSDLTPENVGRVKFKILDIK